MVTVCAVPPVTYTEDGLNEHVTSVTLPPHASMTGLTKPVVPFSVAVTVPVPPRAMERVDELSDPVNDAGISGV
jgi:hypothetical protein